MTKSFKSKNSFPMKKKFISQKIKTKICLKSKNSIKNQVSKSKTQILNFDNILEILFSNKKKQKLTKEKIQKIENSEKSIFKLI